MKDSALLTFAFLALALFVAVVLGSCTAQQGLTGARALHFGSDVCRAIASNANRPDVEQVCGLAHDGSEVLEQALVVHVCDIPDAGGQ